MTIKIALIGTLPPPVGGTSISLGHLNRSLEGRDDVQVKVVNTGGIRGKGLHGIRQFVQVVWKIFQAACDVDVVTLHIGLHALPLIGPFVLLGCRLFRKPLLIRRFGGNDHRELKGFSFRVGQWVIRHADLYLVQTQALKNAAKEANLERVEWFPTSRPMSNQPLLSDGARNNCRRFVFLSHIRPTKGISEIIIAAERLDDDVTVNVYGPLYDGLTEDIFNNCNRVRYCGVADPDSVPGILKSHDALLLPTYYGGEGYPGVILEAFNAGIPVITTLWKAIPEIVDETCGILVQPRDAEKLYQAMSQIVKNELFYQSLCRGVLERRTFSDFEKWTDNFVFYCTKISKFGSSEKDIS